MAVVSHNLNFRNCFRVCIQGGRDMLTSGSTLAGGQKIAQVYKQDFTGKVTLKPRTT